MSLSDAYESLEKAEGLLQHPQCKTCRWYSDLSPGDRTFFDGKAANPQINYRRLLRACKETGLDVANSSFRSHIQEHHDQLQEMMA